MIQIAAASNINIYLPSASTCPLGSKIGFTNNSGTFVGTIVTNSTGTANFIYNGGLVLTTLNSSITVQGGETLELTSRGNTEWDVTNGTAELRYQGQPWIKNSIPPNSAANTAMPLDNVNARLFQSSFYLLAQVSPFTVTGQTWNWSGSANINGQAAITYSQPNQTVNTGTWYNIITQPAPSTQLHTSGDSALAFLQDSNANKAYQLTYLMSGTTGAINIQRIA